MSHLHFFDVGANIGQTFDDFLLKTTEFDGAHIWCFEPSPRHLHALMARAETLRDRFRIHVCPFGLGAQTATPIFHQKDDPRGDSFCSYLASDHLTQNLEPGYALHGAIYAIADFILEHTAPEDRIILKLDCEGSEYALLAQLLLRPEALARVSRILVEWHTIKPAPAIDAEGLQYLYQNNGRPLERWQF